MGFLLACLYLESLSRTPNLLNNILLLHLQIYNNKKNIFQTTEFARLDFLVGSERHMTISQLTKRSSEFFFDNKCSNSWLYDSPSSNAWKYTKLFNWWFQKDEKATKHITLPPSFKRYYNNKIFIATTTYQKLWQYFDIIHNFCIQLLCC